MIPLRVVAGDVAGLLTLKLEPLIQLYAGGGLGIAILAWERGEITPPLVITSPLVNGLAGICYSLREIRIYGHIRYINFFGVTSLLAPGVGFYIEF